MKTSAIHLSVTVLSSLLFFNVADATENLPLHPRVFVTGAAGTAPGFSSDVMLPLYGTTHGMLYTNLQAKYVQDDNSWFAGLGAGYRHILSQDALLGSYVFIDRSAASSEKVYWSANLGLEGIYQQWDWHTNGYVPVSKQSYQLQSQFASQQGDYSYVNFSGHEQYDRLYINTETVSSGGMDAEVGYRIRQANQLRLALGGYYFNLKNNQMRGVIGTVEYPLNSRFSVLAQNAYDNVQGNTLLLSLRMRFGGNEAQGIQGHLLDPVQRNLGTLGTGTSLPVTRRWVNQGQVLEQSDVWFFKPGGANYQPAAGLNNCTAEQPCSNTNLTQQNIDNIQAVDTNAHLYLAPSVYVLDDIPSGSGRISLNPGQSIEGRSSDYKMPAVDAQRPALFGGVDLKGDNILANITLDNNEDNVNFVPYYQTLMLNNNSSQAVGIRAEGNTQIIDSRIGNLNGNSYITAILTTGFGTTTIRGSEINASRNTAAQIRAIFVNGGTIIIDRSTIRALADNPTTTFTQLVATGVEINGGGAILNSTIEATANYLRNNSNLENRFAIAQGVVLLNGTGGLVVRGGSHFNISARNNLNNSEVRTIGIVNFANSTRLIVTDNYFNFAAHANINTGTSIVDIVQFLGRNQTLEYSNNMLYVIQTANTSSWVRTPRPPRLAS